MDTPDMDGRERLIEQARTLADQFNTKPTGVLERQLVNVLARIRNNIY